MSSGYEFEQIFTLNAESNLRYLTDDFQISDERMFAIIQASFKQMRDLLASKGIEYSDLKRALVPNADRDERAFVFDWTGFKSNWYGREAANLILPLLEKRSSRSVLVGDWVSSHRFYDIYVASFGEQVDAVDERFMKTGPYADTLYFVYLNNLTPAGVERLESALTEHPAYITSLDLRYASLAKEFLSTMLVRAYIQHRKTILMGHEDDLSDSENVNMAGFDFEGVGYEIRSVPLWMYDSMLSYKIERPVLPDEPDTQISLSAISQIPIPIAQCDVELDERKLDYLQQVKAGSMRRADLHTLSAEEIAFQIRSKLSSNYIFNLARSKNGETLKFNILLENIGVARYLCALEYLPLQKTLRVITLF